MADTMEPKFNTLADRIAALNNQPNFSSPSSVPPSSPSTSTATPGKRRPPPPPPPGGRSQHESRSQTQPVPVVPQPNKSPTIPPRPQRAATIVAIGGGGGAVNKLDPPPCIPNRHKGDSKLSPAMPPRRPSGAHQLDVKRRGSNSSDVSHLSTFSTLSISATSIPSNNSPLHKVPPTLKQAPPPPLPPTRRELEARAKESGNQIAVRKSGALSSHRDPAPLIPKIRTIDPAPVPDIRPALPPRLPSRPSKSPIQAESRTPSPGQARRLPPPPNTWKRPESADRPPPLPGSRPRPGVNKSAPPPVPTNSRPSFAQVEAAAATPVACPTITRSPAPSAPQPDSCLVCRDFSAPDSVAAQYPRHTLPRSDPASYLARVLCDPFPALTDKARAIFTWCHHNIAYDTHAFFNKCVKHQTTDDLIHSGLAVCMGYSKVYHDIAVRAGLECVEVSGHGKGFGFTSLKLGEPTPAQDHNHAWNAVRIDGGEWKLLDSCWGAGSVTNEHTFNKHLNCNQFTMSNERFGWWHFPTNKKHFFLPDGKRIPSWTEYVWGPKDQAGVEKCNWYTSATTEGLDEHNFEPYGKHISLSAGGGEPTVRFQFGKLCPHWTVEKQGQGQPYLWMLEIGGVDGREKQQRYINQNAAWYWVDVPRRDLGAPGQKIKLMALSKMNGQDGRGLTRSDWDNKGCGSWCFQSLADWEVVR